MKTSGSILISCLLPLLTGQELSGQQSGRIEPASATAQQPPVNPPEQDLLLIGAVRCKQEKP
ncbi:MAG: hypothetical protein LBR86_02685 [Tannerella sp.]|jgi:hypothetical protein|nr:hypothetical protein [Tannerella sp.]